MALLIDCPGCGNSIVNNGQDCPFCGYSVKTGKTREEIEQELLAAEEALRAEEEAKAAAEAARLEQERLAEEARRAAEEAARLEQERREEEARLAAEEARRQAQQNTIFAKFQQRNAARTQQVDLTEKVNNDLDYLPGMPTGDDSLLPPMQLERPVSLSEIANTPAVPLTQLAKEQEQTVLPPMQLEREVSINEIMNTPAVHLSPIQKEEVNDALPDIDSPEAAPPRRSQPEITVEMPSSKNPDIQVSIPQQPAKPSVVLQKKETPIQQRPVQPIQQPVQPRQPRPQRQWTADPNEQPQRPVQQPMQQPPMQSPVQQQPQRPVQQRQPRPQRQWTADPNEQPQRPVQPPMQQPPMQQPVQQPMQQQRPVQPRQPRPQRQWTTSNAPMGVNQPLQPIQQERSEVTSTGERLSDLPPQQVPSDPNFDQTSYVKNLKRQMYAGKMGMNDNNGIQEEAWQQKEVAAEPMKHDENAKVVASNMGVNRVTVPKTPNKVIVPVIIIVVLMIALGVTAYITLFKNPLGSGGSSSTASDSSSVSSGSSASQSSVHFTGIEEADYDLL